MSGVQVPPPQQVPQLNPAIRQQVASPGAMPQRVPQQAAPQVGLGARINSDPWLKSDASPAGANTLPQVHGVDASAAAGTTSSMMSAQSSMPQYKTSFTPPSAGASGAQTVGSAISTGQQLGSAYNTLSSDADVKEDVTGAGGAESSAMAGTAADMSNQTNSAEKTSAPGAAGGGGSSMMSTIGTAAGIAMMLMSDKKAKEQIHPAGMSISDEFLRSLSDSESTYKYKDPRNEPTSSPTGGHYLGVMAQAVEKTPTGKTIVKDGPRGKFLEMGPMVSALAAGEGRLNERLTSLEDAVRRVIELTEPSLPQREAFRLGSAGVSNAAAQGARLGAGKSGKDAADYGQRMGINFGDAVRRQAAEADRGSARAGSMGILAGRGR